MSNPIHFVAYKPEEQLTKAEGFDGDILCGKEWVKAYKALPKELDGYVLRHIAHNPWEALAMLGVVLTGGNAPTNLKYKCPWSDNHYWWAVPVGISALTIADRKKFNNPILEEPYDFTEDLSDYISDNITRCFLGHGYISATFNPASYTADEIVEMQLSDGRKLYAVCNVWFNK